MQCNRKCCNSTSDKSYFVFLMSALKNNYFIKLKCIFKEIKISYDELNWGDISKNIILIYLKYNFFK